MAVLRPKVAMLDEIDSGLDIDAVRQVAGAVEEMRSPDLGVVMITHYSRILRYLMPDRIHVMIDGRIVDSGGGELAEELEQGGYEAVRQRLGIEKVAAGTCAEGVRPVHRHPFRRLSHGVEGHGRGLALGELTNLPTASGREEAVIAWAKAWAARRPDLRLSADSGGNLLITQRGRSRRAPVLAVAHMDHPAFVIESVFGNEARYQFRGGVRPEYFPDARVVFVTGEAVTRTGHES